MLQRTAYLDASVKRGHYLSALSQHFVLLVGLDGLEPSTSRLSGARSSHLSYRPISSFGLFGSFHCAVSVGYPIFHSSLHFSGEEWDSNLILERSSRDRSRLTISYSNFRFAVQALRIENWWR